MLRAALLFLALGWSAPRAAADWLGVWDPLTTARSVRTLPPDQAAARRPVKLAGVVTFARGPGHDFWVQDATAGVRVVPPADFDADLSVGDRVEVEGATDRGAFDPVVRAAAVRKAGPGDLPAPRPFDLTPESARWLTGQWVESHVQVRGAFTESGVTRVEVFTPRGASGTLLVPGEKWAAAAKSLRGVELAVRGVCVPTLRGAANHGPPSIHVATLPDPPAAEEPAGPAAGPTVVSHLRGFVSHPYPESRRARLAGVVTAAPFPGVLAVQDHTGAATVWAAAPRTDVPVGSRVEVVGLLRIDGQRVGLTRAEVTVLGTAPLPEPVTIDPGELAGRFRDAQRVRVAGRVEDVRRTADGGFAVAVSAGAVRFEVFAPAGAGPESGSRVEVVGVPLEAMPDGSPGAGPAVFVRDLADVVVVAPPPRPPAPDPPWWTSRRVAYLTAGFLVVAAVGVAWVWALRVRVRRAAGAIRGQYEETARLERELRQAAKMEAVGRLAGGIAHDFNNLLTVINGCAELLADEATPDRPQLGELVADIRRAGDRAAALTGQLLAFSRKKDVAVSAVDLNDVVVEAARLLDRVLGEHIRIETRLAPDLPPVHGDPGLIHQVVMNLAGNARDAMPSGGTLMLSTGLAADPGEGGAEVPVGSAPRKYARLAVADTGTGMSEEVKARIFEPFFTTKEVGKGTGLGLATVYGAVRTLGGHIRVDSEVGRGTTFAVDFRLHGDPPSSAPPSGLTTTPPPARALRPFAPAGRLSGVTVLVVEDNELVRELLVTGLSGEGAAVLAAARADHALRVLGVHPGAIDVVVTDVVMPVMSGRELADRVWAEWPGVRVVFMSGYTADEMAQRGVDEDRVEFVQKPFTPDHLTTRLLRVLGREG